MLHFAGFNLEGGNQTFAAIPKHMGGKFVNGLLAAATSRFSAVKAANSIFNVGSIYWV